jgi:hypothetical protein
MPIMICKNQTRKFVPAVLAISLLGAQAAHAVDVAVAPPAAGGFVVQNAGGTLDRFRVQESGTVLAPGLSGATPVGSALCFDSGTGQLGPCLAGAPVTLSKSMTLSAPGFTSLASWAVAAGDAAGGYIDYTIVATDGGAQLATEHGRIQFDATRNSITCTADTTDKLHLGTVNSGCTPGFFNPGSQPGVSIFDNVSFTTPAPIVVHTVYFEIHNQSATATRLEP